MSLVSKENHHQLSGLVLVVGTYVLQKVFEKQYISFSELELYLKSHQRTLNSLRDKCILQPKHIESLNPSNGQKPKLEEMDMTLVYILLRHLCPIEKPHNGWDSPVSESDKTIGGDILRLKNMRHDLFVYRHKKPFTTENYFCHWKVTFDAILRLAVCLNKNDMPYIIEQVARIVTEDIVEERRERECKLCIMLCSGFKDDLKETVVRLQKKCALDGSKIKSLKDFDEKLKDAHITNDNLVLIGEELCSLERADERQRIQKESIPETPKRPLPLIELSDVQRGPMDAVHTDCIRRNIVQLKEDLVCTDILDDIIQERIFADEDVHRIHAATTQKAKNDEFFLILPKRGPRAFPVFLNALREKGYLGLVKKIEETLEQVQQATQDSQRTTGNESLDEIQGPCENDETNRLMVNFGEGGLTLHRTIAGTEEERTIITRVSHDLSNPISSHPPTGNNQTYVTGFIRDVRGVSVSPPLGVIYPEGKAQSNDSPQQDDRVRYGISEIPDTSPKEVDDTPGIGVSSLQVKLTSTLLEGATVKKTSYGNLESRSQFHQEGSNNVGRSTEANHCPGFHGQRASLFKSIPSNDNRTGQQWTKQDGIGVSLKGRNENSGIGETKDQPQEGVAQDFSPAGNFRTRDFQKPATSAADVMERKTSPQCQQGKRAIDKSQRSGDAGLQNYSEQGRTTDSRKSADCCIKNKNLHPCKTLRNKNLQPGKPLEKSVSCLQIPTPIQRLPKEYQMEEYPIETTQTGQLEKNYRDSSEWVQYAQKKIDEATSENRLIEDFQTILCLDASYSMMGKGWKEARRFIVDYIAALESQAVDHGIIECVALTVFGAKTDIEQSLTTDLKQILQALENIIPCGPTQLYGGLYMALAAQGGYQPLIQNQVKHCPQIILLTDGRATHTKLVAGPDVQDPKEMKEIHSTIIKVVEEIAAKNICINCVPVGDADMYLLGMIASKAKGKIYDHISGRVLAQRTSNTLNAGYVLQHYELVTIQELSLGGTCPISLEDAVTKEFPEVKKEHGFESFCKLPEHERTQVLAVAKDIIKYHLWEGTTLSLSEIQRNEGKGEKHINSGPEGMSYKFSRVLLSGSSNDILVSATFKILQQYTGEAVYRKPVSILKNASGDVMMFKETERSIKEENANQWQQVGIQGTDNETTTEKDLDFHQQEIYESKEVWTSIAVMELNKARQRESGFIDTVICIDTSASMRGEEWTQVKTFYIEFLSGLEDMNVEQHMTYDRVTLVVFGSITKVLVELTNDFSSLRQEFGRIRLGGPTPLYGGLMLALSCLGGSSVKMIKGIPVCPRIILISDGKPTESVMVSGPDIFDPGSLSEISDEVRDIVKKLSIDTVKVHCIPVGDADDRILRMIAEVSNGKLYSFKEGRHLARRTLNANQAGPMLNHWKCSRAAAKVQGNELSLEDFMDQVYQHPELEGAINILEEDKKGIRSILEEYEEVMHKKKLNPEKDMHIEAMRGDLPPLGTRVHSEPDWNPEDENCRGYGTVVGHIPLHKEIYVEWDSSSKVTKCRYGRMRSYDVSPVEVPRILDEDQIIAVGCVVIRGPDWVYGDQDGFPGTKGAVIKVEDDGRVLVRWSSGSKCYYRFSQDNKYDLVIVG